MGQEKIQSPKTIAWSMPSEGFADSYELQYRGSVTVTEADLIDYSEWVRSDISADVITVSGQAENVINCRCTFVATVSED